MSLKLPGSWTTANLFDVCHPTQWKTISISELVDSGYSVYGANGKIGFYDKYTHESPTIMITCRGATCGNIHISVPFSYINGNAMALDGLKNEFCELTYLAYLLQARGLDDVISGSAQPQITRTSLKRVDFPLAPRAEQTRIVEKLDGLLYDLNAGVAELKAAQKKLGQYRQSLLKAAVEGSLTAEWRAKNSPTETGAQLLQRILTERRKSWEAKQLAKFKEQGNTPPKDWQKKYPEPVQPDTTKLSVLPKGWVWSSLDQLSEFITSGSRGWADYYAESGATFIRSQNINKDWLDLSDIAFVRPPVSTEGIRTRVRSHDLLLTITGANVGKAAWVEGSIGEAYVSQHVALIRPIEPTLAPFLHMFLIASAGGRGHLNKEAYGAGKPGLNLQQVGAVTVPLPSVSEIPALIDSMARQVKALTEQAIAIELAFKQSAAQRKNILKAAFSGQLVPQDPNDEPASVLLARIRAERAAAAVPKTSRARLHTRESA